MNAGDALVRIQPLQWKNHFTKVPAAAGPLKKRLHRGEIIIVGVAQWKDGILNCNTRVGSECCGQVGQEIWQRAPASHETTRKRVNSLLERHCVETNVEKTQATCIPCSLMVRIPRFHRVDPGSIPGIEVRLGKTLNTSKVRTQRGAKRAPPFLFVLWWR